MGQVDTGRAGRRDRRTEHRRSRSLPAVLLAALAAVLVACGPVTAPPAPSSAPASSTTAGPTSSSPSTGPTAAQVAAAVEPGLETSPGTVSAEFRDLATGEVLYARDADEPVAPASSLKVLAAAAIVSALGPETTLQTTVVAQPTADGAATELVLVGGGDVLLGTGASDSTHVSGRAGLRTLAERTVAGLVEDGVTGQVVVSTDLRLFTDRTALNPRWTSDIPESGNIAPVQPLATYGGREAPGTGEDRIEAPAQFAALTFQAALDDAVAASGADLEVGLRDTIPATEVPRATVLAAAPVAAVESAPVGEQVAYLLAHSENQVVEALAHTAAPADDLSRRAQSLLRGWDGNETVDSVPATIFEAWLMGLQNMARDELGDAASVNSLAVLNQLRTGGELCHDEAAGVPDCAALLTRTLQLWIADLRLSSNTSS